MKAEILTTFHQGRWGSFGSYSIHFLRTDKDGLYLETFGHGLCWIQIEIESLHGNVMNLTGIPASEKDHEDSAKHRQKLMLILESE